MDLFINESYNLSYTTSWWNEHSRSIPPSAFRGAWACHLRSNPEKGNSNSFTLQSAVHWWHDMWLCKLQLLLQAPRFLSPKWVERRQKNSVTSLICAFEFFNYLIIVLLFRSISFHVAFSGQSLPLYPIGGTNVCHVLRFGGTNARVERCFLSCSPAFSFHALSFPFVSFHFLSLLFIAFDFMSFPLPTFHFHLFFLSISFQFLIIFRFFGCSFPLISSLFSFSGCFPFL